MYLKDYVGDFPNYTSFIMAKDFRIKESGQLFLYKLNAIETCGRGLRWGIGGAFDLLLREIKNPIMVIALTAIAALIVTICFYPTATIAFIGTVAPFLFNIKPWMIKMAIYISFQSTALGVGLRGYGRLLNTELCNHWKRGELEAVYIGDRQKD